MTMYRGFSTVGRNKRFRLDDFDLVKQDLINNFNIRKGEKLMNPNYGTMIWNVLFEPMTPTLQNLILTDIKTIIGNDPRIETDNIVVTTYLQGIQVQLELRYKLTNQTSALNMQFDQTSKTVTTG